MDRWECLFSRRWWWLRHSLGCQVEEASGELSMAYFWVEQSRHKSFPKRADSGWNWFWSRKALGLEKSKRWFVSLWQSHTTSDSSPVVSSFPQCIRFCLYRHKGEYLGYSEGWSGSTKLRDPIDFKRVDGNVTLMQFTHKGHRGPVSDMNWNPY